MLKKPFGATLEVSKQADITLIFRSQGSLHEAFNLNRSDNEQKPSFKLNSEKTKEKRYDTNICILTKVSQIKCVTLYAGLPFKAAERSKAVQLWSPPQQAWFAKQKYTISIIQILKMNKAIQKILLFSKTVVIVRNWYGSVYCSLLAEGTKGGRKGRRKEGRGYHCKVPHSFTTGFWCESQ